MKRESVNYFSVGLFALATLGLLLYVLFRISTGAGDKDSYYTHYRNVSGLSGGTQVTYEGYALGHIAAIEPQRNEQGLRYRVELRIDKGWQIPADSVAHIASEGLLAETVINISEGVSADILQPGDSLAGEQGTDLLAALGKIAGSVGDLSENGIGSLLQSLNNTAHQLDSELGARLPVILDDVQSMVAKLDSSATYLSGILNAETEITAQRIIGNVDHASADFRTLTTSLVEIKDQARELVTRLDSMAVKVEPELLGTVTELRRIVERVSHYSDGILQNLDSTSRNMSEFSRQIRENPRRLIGGSAPRDPGGRE